MVPSAVLLFPPFGPRHAGMGRVAPALCYGPAGWTSYKDKGTVEQSPRE